MEASDQCSVAGVFRIKHLLVALLHFILLSELSFDRPAVTDVSASRVSHRGIAARSIIITLPVSLSALM